MIHIQYRQKVGTEWSINGSSNFIFVCLNKISCFYKPWNVKAIFTFYNTYLFLTFFISQPRNELSFIVNHTNTNSWFIAKNHFTPVINRLILIFFFNYILFFFVSCFQIRFCISFAIMISSFIYSVNQANVSYLAVCFLTFSVHRCYTFYTHICTFSQQNTMLICWYNS